MYHLSEAISVWRVGNNECLLWWGGVSDDAIHLVEERRDPDFSLSLSLSHISFYLFVFVLLYCLLLVVLATVSTTSIWESNVNFTHD